MCLHIITDKPVVTELVQVQPLNKFLAIIRVENYKEHPAICYLYIACIFYRHKSDMFRVYVEGSLKQPWKQQGCQQWK